MKKSWGLFIVLSVVLGVVFSASSFSFADDGKKDGHRKDRIEYMKKKLGLSDDQVSKIKAVYEDSKKNIEPLMKQKEADIKTLKDKVTASASDNDIKALLAAIQSDQQKIMDIRKAEMNKVKTILTPTQQAKAFISMHKRWGHSRNRKEKCDCDKDNK